MAQDMDADWFAVYVESRQQLEMNAKARVQLDKNIHLAEELGANVILLKGTNVADEIINFAKEKKVTLIIAGPSKRTVFDRIFKGTVLTKLINSSGNINVLIARDTQREKEPQKIYEFRKSDFRAYLASLAAIMLTIGAGLLLRSRLEPMNMAMLLLLPSIASGIFWGIRAGLFASIVSVAAFDFFFVPPYFTFQIADIRFLPSFIVFILVSFVTSYFAKSVRQEAESSRHRERFVYSLYSFTRAIMAAQGLENIFERAVKSISEAFESNVVILLPDSTGRLQLKARDKENVLLNDREMAVAVWVYTNGRPAGKSTDTLSSAAWYYLPLKIQEKTIGVAGIKSIIPEKFLTSGQNQLLESFTSIVALAINKSY